MTRVSGGPNGNKGWHWDEGGSAWPMYDKRVWAHDLVLHYTSVSLGKGHRDLGYYYNTEERSCDWPLSDVVDWLDIEADTAD